MRVRDLMQTVVRSIDEAAHLDLAEELMREEVIRHLPVLSGRRLVGMVTQRDLLRAGLPSVLGFGPDTEQRMFAAMPVRRIMTRDVLRAHPDADLASAIDMMLRERIGCLPVVQGEELVGLLSETDCLRYLAELLRGEPSP